MSRRKTNKIRSTLSQNALITWFKKKKAKATNTIEDQSKTRIEAEAQDESEEYREVEQQERVTAEEKLHPETIAGHKAEEKAEVKAKDKTEGLTDANSFEAVKYGKRGVSPAEILKLIEHEATVAAGELDKEEQDTETEDLHETD